MNQVLDFSFNFTGCELFRDGEALCYTVYPTISTYSIELFKRYNEVSLWRVICNDLYLNGICHLSNKNIKIVVGRKSTLHRGLG